MNRDSTPSCCGSIWRGKTRATDRAFRVLATSGATDRNARRNLRRGQVIEFAAREFLIGLRGRRRLRRLGSSRRLARRALRSGRAPRPAIVGQVETRTFELDRRGADQLLQSSAATRADRERSVVESLDDLSLLAAFLALVFVQWHDVSSRKSFGARVVSANSAPPRSIPGREMRGAGSRTHSGLRFTRLLVRPESNDSVRPCLNGRAGRNYGSNRMTPSYSATQALPSAKPTLAVPPSLFR